MKKITEKLNWFTITKKYWKEQLTFYLLTISSFLLSFVIKSNALSAIYKLVRTGEKKGMVFSAFWREIYVFSDWQSYAWLMTGIIIVYCLIVLIHVYYRFYFSNKIIYDIKQEIVNKFLKIQGSYSKKQVINTLTYDVRNFVDMVAFVPNQIFLIIISAIFTFSTLRTAQDNTVLLMGIGYFILTVIIGLGFNYLLYKKDLLFQKKLEIQAKKENILVNNRNLIIKKNCFFSFQEDYKPIVGETCRVANQSDFLYSLAWVIPSYSLIPLAQIIFLPFVSSEASFIASDMLLSLFDELKKMIERLKDYPYYFSSKKRLNEFLFLAERDDLQKNLLIAESIEDIALKNVSFSYGIDKAVLHRLNLTLNKGKVNHLTGKNGFGKSTIINLITGLYQPDKGEIIINERHKLNEMNLNAWREKIAYAEHENLIESGLSTGQKQLADLNNLFANSENKEVFIFDEADNALDQENQAEFRKRIDLLAKNKLVILISH